MKLLIFGMLVEDFGSQEFETKPLYDIDSLRKFLIEKFPILQNRKFIIAVNKQKIDGNMALKPDDEIALIPPFAGG